jgi:cysteine desulfurase
MHTDAVQAAGNLVVDLPMSGAHMLTLSAHKLYGPKGIGVLVMDRALDLEPLVHGGGQETGLRGGTENLAGIVGFGRAAELALARREMDTERLLVLRERLQSGLAAREGVVIFAADAPRLPNTVQCALPGLDGEALVLELDRRGYAVSSGSACHSGRGEPSHVLLAMGVDPVLARSAIRISLGRTSTEADVDGLLAALDDIRQHGWPAAGVSW